MFRYDSGKRLTANGGVMDMNVVPADEERYGEPPASFSGSSSSSAGGADINPAVIGGVVAVAAAAGWYFTQGPGA